MMPHFMPPVVDKDTAVGGERPAVAVGGVFCAVWALAFLLTFHDPDRIRFVLPFALLVIAPLALLDCGVVVFYWVRKKKMSVMARVLTLLPLALVLAAALAADGL